MPQIASTSSSEGEQTDRQEHPKIENTPPLVEIESEGGIEEKSSLNTDLLWAISVKPHPPVSPAPPSPLPTLQEVSGSWEEYVIQGKILSRLSVQLRSARFIFLIVATLYFGSRMLVVSGIAPVEFARWVHNLEPALFLVTVAYIAVWCAFVCTGASLRFAFTRYVFFLIACISTIVFSLWWSDMFSIF